MGAADVSPERTRLEKEGEIAVLILDSPPVNALSLALRQGMQRDLQRAIADPEVAAIVMLCAGRTFISGADIREFGQAAGTRPTLQELIEQTLETSPKPIVAAIHGTALGGGLEVALGCHYRVAVPSARCGLPEVTLGILPAAGGTQRLPRLVGVEKALDLVTSGRHVDSAECLAIGLIDELAPEDALRATAVAAARRIVREGKPLRRVSQLEDQIAAARGRPEIFAEFRKANARKFRGFQAPESNIRCIEAAVSQPFEAGLKVERDRFVELLRGTQSAAQRYVFFAERQVWKIPDVPADTPVQAVAHVGIIGAGTMGGGIAMCFANAGIRVTIVEVKKEALERGLGVVRKNYENSAKRGRFPMEEVERRMGRIQGSLAMEDLADCDLIIEAIFENMAVKKEVFGKLDRIARPGAILATNTSALNIDEIATAVQRPEAVIGLHFFSPANVMRLLEVVRADKTSKSVIATSMQIAKQIGKLGVLVGVCPGFVGNRILGARNAQSQALLQQGCLPWEIDRVIYEFGLPMGPFAMSDLAGLDIGWSKERSKGETLRDRLCEMNRRGQKTGAGYYDYDESRNARPSPVVEGIIREILAKRGVEPRAFSDEEILERCIYPMINEGAKILQEGKAIRASDIDMVWTNGYGWPVYRGGPMFYADTVGLDKVVAKLQELATRFGPTFEPAPLLLRAVADGKPLHQL